MFINISKLQTVCESNPNLSRSVHLQKFDGVIFFQALLSQPKILDLIRNIFLFFFSIMYLVEILSELSGYKKPLYTIFVPYFLQVPEAQNLHIILWPHIITLYGGYEALLRFYEEINPAHLP
jgi:hypothetical protein